MEVEQGTPEAAPAAADTLDTAPEQIETEDTEFATPSEDSETTDEAEQPRFTVKLAGKEVEVTLDELRNGYQRQQDYTAKTMAVAEREKELTARRERWDAAITQGETIAQALAAEFQAEFSGVNWGELAANDPAEYVRKQHAAAIRQGKLQQAIQQLEQTKQARAAEDEQASARRIDEERKALFDKLPEWRDEKKANAEAAEIRGWLTQNGYTPEQVNSLTDHRDVITARKAMLYDRLMAKVPKAAAVPSAPPPPEPARSKAKAAPDPDKMTVEQWMKWRNADLKRKAGG